MVVSLIPVVKDYDWGNRGSRSMINSLLSSQRGSSHVVHEDTPAAEMWMGDHPSGPALVEGPNGERISIAEAREGKEGIPFLFKVPMRIRNQ